MMAPERSEAIPRARLRRLADEPLAEAVGPDLVRLPLPTPTLPPATTTNHVLVGAAAAVLVDPATPDPRSRWRLVALVAALAQTGVRLEALLLSHHHRDHIGAAAHLRSALGLPIWAHRATATLLDGRLTVDRCVAHGEPVALDDHGDAWLALHTPGHAPGHLALWHPRTRRAVVADLVAAQGTILIDPRDGHMATYLATLDALLERQPALLVPAHGGVIREPVPLLQRYIAHRRAREARVAAALTRTWRRDDTLLPTVYGDVPRRTWPLALRSMRSHLIHLAEQGRAEGHRDGRRWRARG
jgi:glyoxylase-like metal-dependent hydrolase (beta-lactamase superfamily II)